MNTEAIYTALKDYIELALQATAEGVPDTDLQIEIADSDLGEEWTGIRMSKLPTASTQRVFVSGTKEVVNTYQLTSKQEHDRTGSRTIAYSTYLERLAGELNRMFKAKQHPALPDGAELKKVEAVQQSTLNSADGKYSSYILDIRFTLQIRS